MNVHFVFLFLILSLLSCQSASIREPVPIGEKVVLFSRILDEEREILVYLPDEYNPQARYPVLYVLDGESLFYPVSGIVNFLSSQKENDFLPKMIVIGITNTNRGRDLVPVSIPGEKEVPGGERFISFFQRELIPFIEREYAASSNRTILGQSYGGMWSVYVLIRHPELFDNYIALDGSLRYLRESSLATDSLDQPGKSLYLAIANTYEQDTSQLWTDFSADAEHVRTLFEVSRRMDSCVDCALDFHWKYFPNEDHASLCVVATHDALRTLFSWYHLDLPRYLHPPEEVSDTTLFEEIESHFEGVSEKMGYEVPPPEWQIHMIASSNIRKRPELAFRLLEVSQRHYPDHFNTHFLQGRYHEQKGQIEAARKSYERALKIRESEEVREILKNL